MYPCHFRPPQNSKRETENAATHAVDEKIAAALAKLPPEDRELATSQQFCPVLDKSRLGSMGVPVKIMIDGEPVFLCCPGCRGKALKDPPRPFVVILGGDRACVLLERLPNGQGRVMFPDAGGGVGDLVI